ncbi:PH domain-containing protein [Sorangium sp. So ce1024]|uniref:PH domain-containing protein n=1 Tax=Sorangium sp. So ce1024 TaxID=3133327 RepID=UPI003F09A21A
MTSPRLRIESSSLRIVSHRRRAWARRIAVVGGWGVSMALLAAYAPDLTGIYGTALTFLCLALLVGSLRGGPAAGAARRGEPGAVTVVDGGALCVQIGGRTRTIARGDVVAGWTEEGRGQGRVLLQIRTGEVIAADVTSAADGHALLEALGVAPEQRAVAVQLGSPHTPTRRFVLALVGLVSLAVAAPSALISAGLVMMGLGGSDWLGTLALMGFLSVISGVGAWRCLRPLVGTTLRIGTDGLSIRRLLRRRFVPRAEIAGVGVRGAALVVERRSGGPVVVMASSAEEAASLASRVTDALAGRAVAAPAETLAALDRAGRPLAEWKHAILALLQESAGYRRAGIVADDLFSVLEDGAARPERRVAAAAALASSGEPAAQARVRAAVEACVGTKLRIAMLRAADGEIDEGALAAAEEEAMRRA